MRRSIFAVMALAVALSAGTASVALAQALPDGVKVANGSLTDKTGKALYTYAGDTMKNMSHCEAQCAKDWPPLLAAKTDMPSGDWTIFTRDDGKRQWAYKSQPLYTYSKDKAGSPASGWSVKDWKLARP